MKKHLFLDHFTNSFRFGFEHLLFSLGLAENFCQELLTLSTGIRLLYYYFMPVQMVWKPKINALIDLITRDLHCKPILKLVLALWNGISVRP
jgi:hypothetical protein